MDYLIQSHQLTKFYGATHALVDVDIHVRQGEIFGFLGPNGAGKTTFVKILLNFVFSTRGTLEVMGETPHRIDRKKIGYLPERISIHPFLTGREFLEYQGNLIDRSGSALKTRINECLEKVKMTDAADRRISEYSKGMLQRIGVAQAILGEPELLVLDEPNSGLDPIGVQDIREIIQDEKKRGATVFLNSHQLLEVEKTCDRVAILNHGRVAAQGSREELSGKQGIALELENAGSEILNFLRNIDPGLKQSGAIIEISIPDSEEERMLPARLVEKGARILSYSRKRESLEQVFRRLVAGDDK